MNETMSGGGPSFRSASNRASGIGTDVGVAVGDAVGVGVPVETVVGLGVASGWVQAANSNPINAKVYGHDLVVSMA